MSQNKDNSFLSRQERRFIPVFRGVHLVGVAFVVFLMGMTVVHVVGRYAFNRPVLGVIELTCFMLVIMIILTGAYTMLRQRHTDMGGIVVGRFSERTQAIISSVVYLLCFVFTILAAWQSFLRGIFLMGSGQTTLILEIPHFPFVYIVGVGWAFFSLAILMLLIRSALRSVKK